jgi:two-component system alkaline phosphatase synthesis response regulator PhoP
MAMEKISRELRVRGRILLIDDSRFIRRLFTFVFEELGYEVHSAADGREGTRMAADGPYDVVVVDGVLPDIEGRDVCRHISRLPGTKPIMILYTASKKAFQERYTAVHDGIDVCLKKEADGQTLVEKVAELLEARDQRLMTATA